MWLPHLPHHCNCGVKARPGLGRYECIYFPLKTPRFQCSVAHVGSLCDSMWYHAITRCRLSLQLKERLLSLDPAVFWRGSLYIQDSYFKGSTLKCTSMCHHIAVVKFMYSSLFLSFVLRWCGSFFPLFFLSLRLCC